MPVARIRAHYNVGGLLGVADDLLHWSRLPTFMWRPLCNRYDRKLGA